MHSQQELRILAELSKEPVFIEALQTGKDLHSYSAALLNNIPYEDFLVYDENGQQIFKEDGSPAIKKDMKHLRDQTKKITFGCVKIWPN